MADSAAPEEEGVFKTPPEARRETVDLVSLPRAFTERVHELSTLSVRLRHDLAVDLADRLKYELELKNFHMLSLDALATTLSTSTERGLGADTAAGRLAKNGPNIITPVKTTPMWLRFILCFCTGFSPLLAVASMFVFLSWKPFGTPPTDVYNLCLAVALLLVIFVSGLFQYYQDIRTTRILKGFDSLIPPDCTVIRDGVPTRVPSKDLVVGDLVTLATGVRVPSDMRVVLCNGLHIDKSLLTGEAEPVKASNTSADKSVSMLQSNNMLLMGCNIVEGEGTGIVIATGESNQLSKIATQAGGDAPMTSLQVEIYRFVAIIATLAITTGIIVIIWWAAWLDKKHNGFMTTGSMIANSISVVVAYIPEGLPLALSMGLTIIARRLCYDHSVLLKRMGTVETLGSISLLASDKTGTLTQNKMTVTSLITAEPIVDRVQSQAISDSMADITPADEAAQYINAVSDNGTKPHGPAQLSLLLRVAVLCNQAKLQQQAPVNRSRAPTENGNEDDVEGDIEAPVALETHHSLDNSGMTGSNCPAGTGELVVVSTNGIDKALMTWGVGVGQAQVIRKAHKREALLPFSSATKMSAVVVRDSRRAGSAASVCVKGAPEYVLAACTSFYTGSGEQCKLQAHTLTAIAAAVEKAASKGQRVVALAEIPALNTATYGPDYTFCVDPVANFPIDGLTFIGCIAVSDPPRLGVKQAVRDLRTAGIKVAMVTGDAASTACAIARQVGIVSSDRDMNRVTHLLTNKDGAASFNGSVDLSRNPITAMDLSKAAVTDSNSLTLASPSSAQLSTNKRSGCRTGASAPQEGAAVLVQGDEIERLDKAAWDYIFMHKELVFSRTTPEQKLQIVTQAQLRRDRVGVTGDGVNDSPALKRADVGIAMASGSDVARDAADIVLLTDEFASIVHGVRQGRTLFANLRKVIAYQISAGSWAELLPVLATFFLGMPQPLSSFLMIVLCCLTDVFAGVALMNEPSEATIMQKPPRDVRRSRLVDFKLVGYSYLFYANFISLGAFLNWFSYMSTRGPPFSEAAQFTLADTAFPIGYRASQLIFAWEWGLSGDALADDQAAAAITASSVFFATLVACQAAHLVSVRLATPYYATPIMNTANSNAPLWQRLWAACKVTRPLPRVLGAWAGALVVTLIVTEVPALQSICGTDSVPALNWGYAIGWALLSFTVAEIRKWIIYLYPSSCVARTAWQ